MKRDFLILICCFLAFLVIWGVVSDQSDAESAYAESFALDCDNLEKYSTTGTAYVSEKWLSDQLIHYQLQPDGRGLAIVMHPEGMDASGTMYTVMYSTSDKGKNWSVLNEMFSYPKGSDAFLYMGKTVVLATDQDKSDIVSILISYNRGLDWSETLYLSDLVNYDTESYPDLKPRIINYNEDTGMITFGWKESFDSEEYLLINQFDVNAQEFVEEVYRNPEF